MKHCLILILFALVTIPMFSQGELVIEKYNGAQDVFYKSKGCTPEDGVIVFYTEFANLKFTMPDTPKRLRNVSTFDKEKNCYVLCIQPTDTKLGGIAKYSIDITAEGYIPSTFEVKDVRVGEAQYFTISSQNDPMIEIEKLKKEVAEMKKLQEGKSNVSATTNQPLQISNKQSSQQHSTTKGALTVSTDALFFNSVGENKLIEVSAYNNNYKVHFLPEWIKTSQYANNLQISCDKNNKNKSRKGHFYIVTGKDKVQISVVQGGKNQQNSIEIMKQSEQMLENQSQAQQSKSENSSKDSSAINWLQEGTKNTNSGNYEEAISYFNKALDINPNMNEAWYNMGIAYGREKNKYKALECYQKAAQLGNKDAQRVLTLMGKKW